MDGVRERGANGRRGDGVMEREGASGERDKGWREGEEEGASGREGVEGGRERGGGGRGRRWIERGWRQEENEIESW